MDGRAQAGPRAGRGRARGGAVARAERPAAGSNLIWGTALQAADVEGAGWRAFRGGREVYEVNPRWTTAAQPDKNDRLDARAVALLVWREAGALPSSRSTTTRDARRWSLIASPTGCTTRRITSCSSSTRTTRRACPSCAGGPARAGGVRDHAARRRSSSGRPPSAGGAAPEAGPGADQGAHRGDRGSPVVDRGISLLTAGALAGHPRPRPSLPATRSSRPTPGAPVEKLRSISLNRGGNRRLNAIVYRIALTQLRCSQRPGLSRPAARRGSAARRCAPSRRPRDLAAVASALVASRPVACWCSLRSHLAAVHGQRLDTCSHAPP